MRRRATIGAPAFRRAALVAIALVAALSVGIESPAQERVRTIGVVLSGSMSETAAEGLREGLETAVSRGGPPPTLDVRNSEGDLKRVEAAARELERAGVDLLVVFSTTPTLAARRATNSVPIVFAIGSDPTTVGLAESTARPGGRLTGLHYLSQDLTAKRLEILHELMPRLRRVVTFHNPENRVATASVTLARDAGRRLNIEVRATPVRSIEEIRASLARLREEDADAYFFIADAMVSTQSARIIERATTLHLPTMAWNLDMVRHGAIAGYGFSPRAIGRLTAGYVARILAGSRPADLPIEEVDVPALVINAGAAAKLGIVVPPALLANADEVIE
jgi:putative tryptophan/tyrosine transport system substrate-binding protein